MDATLSREDEPLKGLRLVLILGDENVAVDLHGGRRRSAWTRASAGFAGDTTLAASASAAPAARTIRYGV
jgi:hypothetical protein